MPKNSKQTFYFEIDKMNFFHAAERAGPKTKFDPVKIVSKQ